jgi:outer membrane protein TolC
MSGVLGSGGARNAPARRTARPLSALTFGVLALGALLHPPAALPAPVPPADTLALRDAVRAALAHHPSLAAAEAAVARAEAGVREAGAARLPMLTSDASFMRFGEPMVVAPMHGFNPLQPPLFDRTLLQGSVTLGYTLFDGGARASRQNRARALVEAGHAGADGARSALIGSVVRAYVQLGAAREILAAHERRVAALERERDRAAQLYERGQAARVVVLRAEAALGAARAELHAARGERDVAQGELARLLALDAAQLETVPLAPLHLPDPGELDRRDLAARALSASPEARRLERAVAAAEATRAEARALWFPSVQLVGRYAEYASAAGREQGEWQGGLQLSLPLFTGGGRRGASDRAAAEARSARAEFALARLALAQAVDRAVAALESERARGAALEAAVEQAAEVARIEELALRAGAGVQTDYLAAEAELLRTRALLAAARGAEVAARVELARIAGDLTVEWLERNLEGGR